MFITQQQILLNLGITALFSKKWYCKHKKNKKKNLFEMDDVKVVVNPLYEDITIVAKLRN